MNTSKEEKPGDHFGEHRIDYPATYYCLVPPGINIFCPDCGAFGEKMMQDKPCRRTILGDYNSR